MHKSTMLFNESQMSELVQAILKNSTTLAAQTSTTARTSSATSSAASSHQLNRVLSAAIHRRALTRASLPLIAQRICRQGSSSAGWMTALMLIQHPILRPRRDERYSSAPSPSSSPPASQQKPSSSAAVKRNDSTTSTVAFGFGGKSIATELCDDARLWRLLETEAPSAEAKEAISAAMRILVRQR
ncbi:Hypothetical protein, putative [Bodo saltans]|uniref:Uncharacterized protein n=1 Tax=Bodo saltans TaxID=75058 RepID=A0A0S4JHR2_BODSA|nr:Hypothetical protein, putative [Bodo saltans]|eukprot:CUG90056.1 Hypothetical protein, putative [Bodo saltans]